MADSDGSSAWRRRERRLRAMLRHERQTVAMALAEASHHSAPKGVRATYSGPRAQKTASAAGKRPGVLKEPELQGKIAHVRLTLDAFRSFTAMKAMPSSSSTWWPARGTTAGRTCTFLLTVIARASGVKWIELACNHFSLLTPHTHCLVDSDCERASGVDRACKRGTAVAAGSQYSGEPSQTPITAS